MPVTMLQNLGFMICLVGVAGIITSTCMNRWSTQDLTNNPITQVYTFQGLWRTCSTESNGLTECRPYLTILGLPALGFAGCIVATAMDPWSTQDLYNNPVTSLFLYQGLWRTCVSQSSGLTECRPYYTILGLPAMLQAVRALMIVGIVLGAFGLLVATFSLKCLRMGNMEDSAKASMTLAAGVMCIVSGICAICGVSVFANMLVTDYWMSTANMYQPGMMQSLSVRYTFGAALFVGWVAGGLAFVGGILMCVACRGLVPEETHYKAVSYKSAGYKSGTAYETKKTPVMDNNTVKSDEGRRSYPSKYDYV